MSKRLEFKIITSPIGFNGYVLQITWANNKTGSIVLDQDELKELQAVIEKELQNARA